MDSTPWLALLIICSKVISILNSVSFPLAIILMTGTEAVDIPLMLTTQSCNFNSLSSAIIPDEALFTLLL